MYEKIICFLEKYLSGMIRLCFKADSVELNYSYSPGDPQSALCYSLNINEWNLQLMVQFSCKCWS